MGLGLRLLLVAVFLRHIKSWFLCASSQNVGGNSPGTESSKPLVKPLQPEDFMRMPLWTVKDAEGRRGQSSLTLLPKMGTPQSRTPGRSEATAWPPEAPGMA